MTQTPASLIENQEKGADNEENPDKRTNAQQGRKGCKRIKEISGESTPQANPITALEIRSPGDPPQPGV